jgi:2-oxoglutarate ferredoxin oxidoreductase subunit alpha
LKFAINAGHGDFARAVYAPGTLEEAYALTRVALETAHKWQTPVILLSDQFLADMRKNVPAVDGTYRPIDRHIVSAGADYMRYVVTDSGVSPRAIPGGDGLVLVDSDEHTEDGHITEDLDARVRLQDKRLRKADGMAREAIPPTYYGAGKAPTVLVCWGSTYGPAREAVDALNAMGKPAAMLHFAQVWPVNVEAARQALSAAKEVISVEGNATGQFANVLKMVGVLPECRRLLKYNGLAFTGEEITRAV